MASLNLPKLIIGGYVSSIAMEKTPDVENWY